MRRLLHLALVAFIGSVGVWAACLPAGAGSSIKIKVDDQPITSYDIAQRTALFRLTGISGGQKAAIQELIDETLEFIEAAKRGVSVPDSRVDLAVADIAQHVKMTPDQLKSALASRGVNIETLRRRIKAQMTWAQLVQMRMQLEGAGVSTSDVTAALFQQDNGGAAKSTEYILQEIIFVVPKGSSNAYVEQRRREAEAFRIRFPGCDKSIEAAKQLKGVVVKSLGRRTSEQLTGPDGTEIKNTSVGKTTHPQKMDAGIDLIAVCSAKTVNSNAAARAQIENKLTLEQNKNLGKDYLAELRKKAVIEYR